MACQLSHTAQDHLPGNEAACSGLGSPWSINPEDNPQQTCLPTGQFEPRDPLTETPFLHDLGWVQLTVKTVKVVQGPEGERQNWNSACDSLLGFLRVQKSQWKLSTCQSNPLATKDDSSGTIVTPLTLRSHFCTSFQNRMYRNNTAGKL